MGGKGVATTPAAPFFRCFIWQQYGLAKIKLWFKVVAVVTNRLSRITELKALPIVLGDPK
jgi:hypothetical protein